MACRPKNKIASTHLYTCLRTRVRHLKGLTPIRFAALSSPTCANCGFSTKAVRTESSMHLIRAVSEFSSSAETKPETPAGIRSLSPEQMQFTPNICVKLEWSHDHGEKV